MENNDLKKYSVFQNLEKAKICSDPFPHIIIENALNEEIHKNISDNFPGENNFKTNFSENNARDNITNNDDESKKLNIHIRNFLHYHSSIGFWQEILELFGDYILETHNNFFSNISELREINLSKDPVQYNKDNRNFNPKNKSIFLQSSAAVNTPVTSEKAVRSVHLDVLNKLYAALYYLRKPEDDSQGGDLQIYKWPEKFDFGDKYDVAENMKFNQIQFDVLNQVDYKANSLIFFINSLDALHGVTPRKITNYERRFFYLTGHLNFKLERISNFHKLKIYKKKITKKFLGL